MTPERWKQIDELAQGALERGDDQRAAFLDEACAGDEALRHEVESQIVYQQQASKFLEEPAFKHAAELMSDSQTETESMEGRTISHYSILRKLGAGGMGDVYLAQDTTLSRNVAIKFLSHHLVAGEQGKIRFVREARAAAALDHPHICAVHEVDEEAGYSFIVMQYVEGETLASRIQQKPIELWEALDIAVQIGDALAEAHSHRIIHRDVKPQNVMLTASGQVKVLDFGLARVVREGSLMDSIGETESLVSMPGAVIGTVPYMSPEQVRGEALDGRSDIFSFGALLYEMLSGRNPFQAESMGATMSSILTKEPSPIARYASELPDELQRIVRKALSKDKEGRYQEIKDLLIDLRELKQELEFEAKLDRSTVPEFRDGATRNEGDLRGWRAKAETAPQQTVHTDESFTTRTTSSTRVVIGEINRHKVGVSLTVAAIVIAAVAAYFYFHRQPVLTEQDTILIADFDNRTGDELFDGTLKQALAVQLEQSPFLNIFSDERVRETLSYMKRSPDERVTRGVAKEICQRQGLKAMLAGSIAPLGDHYVLTLEADNAQTGDVLARAQTEAESKDQVLQALRRAATDLRQKLGESLRSIQKFEAPIEQATTSSLEALKVFQAAKSENDPAKRISLYKRATELDPSFAMAYGNLSIGYNNTGQRQLGAEAARKAFELKDRVSEPERLDISIRYYEVTGESDKVIETADLWNRTYPNKSAIPYNVLASNYVSSGQFEKAIEAANQSIRLAPNWGNPSSILGRAFMRLNRFVEARQSYEQAIAHKLDYASIHRSLYQIAFISGDAAGMQQQLDWLRGRSDEYDGFDWQAETAAFAGQWHRAQELSRRAVDLAAQSNAKEVAAGYASEEALRDALFGQCQQGKAGATRAVALARDRASLPRSSLGLALCGDAGQAQRLVDELMERYPKGTFISGLWLPVIKAASEIKDNNPALAIQALEIASRYEAAAEFWPQYLRGQAYLKLGRGAEAAAEFQKIIDHRGQSPVSVVYPLAHLGVARAAAMSGDATRARQAYQDFFVLWKDADADLSILIEAKRAYAGLK